MREQRFREILTELDRFDFVELLNMVRERFRKEHREDELLSYFEVELWFNWKKESEKYTVEAEKIMPLLHGLAEESRFCLERISVNAMIEYEDAEGVEQKYKVNEAWISYSGDLQPHWKELHYRLEGGKEQVVSRSDLGIGCTIAPTSAGPLKVFSMSGSYLSLMVGTDVAELTENREYLWEYLPGVEAALYYDHDEFPALWSWLHIDEETEGHDTPWYCKHHESKDDLYEGMVYIEDDPKVTITKISDRSLTLSIGSGLQSRIHPIVLDQPNRKVVIWEHLNRRLVAKLYVPEPDKIWSSRFNYSDPVPSGCVVEVSIVSKGKNELSYHGTVDVRTIPCRLKMEDYKGVYWNWFEVWGFVDGKMVVGIDNPQYNSTRCAFRGMLSPGVKYTFPIDDYDRYDYDSDRGDVTHGELTLCWMTVEVGLDIKDGVLKSIPDVQEFVVPEEVRELHFQSLITAPSLRKITLRPGLERFSYALKTFHGERGVKLDVVFEGSLQEWFDSAIGLAGHIGRLVVQGKEYDFYQTEDLVIPEGVSRIGNDFLSNSQVLRSLVLPPSVVEVGDHAFAYCDSLQSVKVLGPASIGGSAFISCHNLIEIDLADGVVALETGCFDFLTKVKSIFIPKSVRKVGRLSSQNDGSCLAPVFCCEAQSKPAGWLKDWNLAYFDPRFGVGHGYDYYHPVKWGCRRE